MLVAVACLGGEDHKARRSNSIEPFVHRRSTHAMTEAENRERSLVQSIWIEDLGAGVASTEVSPGQLHLTGFDIVCTRDWCWTRRWIFHSISNASMYSTVECFCIVE